MLDNNEKRTFKLETARIKSSRLVIAQNQPRKDRQPRSDQAREIVLKLIEAIRKM
jgi:hypothetical protein